MEETKDEKILRLEKEVKELKSVLQTLKEDAEMALSGAWNKSDEGFEGQITLIDQHL